MSADLLKRSLLLLVFASAPAAAADALFQSSFETSICDIAFAETEPNDSIATATGIPLASDSTAFMCGAINPVADEDYFFITLSNPQTLIIETIKADGTPCDPAAPMSLSFFDAGGDLLANDDNGGVGGCASLDGLNNLSLQLVPPGDHYIRVKQTADNIVIPAYVLRITAR